MVSFQCDACTDVVKKPKLDRHYGQCRASFTCIDCSATFAGPSQWKGHISCITEAEKYQKSLYKGAKKDFRSSNGSHKNTQSEIPGKYHQSQNGQRSWSRRQYAPNYVSGANSTPLGSPSRMSPVDSSGVDSSANATKTEPEVGKKRGSDIVADASIVAQPKSTKTKRHDVSNEDKVPEVAADPGAVSELPQEPSSVVNGSTERHGKGKKSKESFTHTSPEDLEEKKSKKRKRNGAVEQMDATLNDKPEDEKRAKKRKHKEKRANGSPSKQSDVPDEETGRVEAVTTDAEEVKEKAKKRKKSKEKRASAEKGDEVSPGEKTELVEKTRKKRKKSEST